MGKLDVTRYILIYILTIISHCVHCISSKSKPRAVTHMKHTDVTIQNNRKYMNNLPFLDPQQCIICTQAAEF